MNKRIRPIIKCKKCNKLKVHGGIGLCVKCYQKENNKWIRMSDKEKEDYRNKL